MVNGGTMQAHAVMTRSDAFLFAIKKMMEQHRAYIDSHDVRSMQLTISINKAGDAHVVISPRSEDTVMGCFDGAKRLDRYDFSP